MLLMASLKKNIIKYIDDDLLFFQQNIQLIVLLIFKYYITKISTICNIKAFMIVCKEQNYKT